MMQSTQREYRWAVSSHQNPISVGRHLKTDYKPLMLSMAIFATAAIVVLANPAFAYQGGDYSHAISTRLTNPDLVCGNHLCGPGEMPQTPKAVEPVGSH